MSHKFEIFNVSKVNNFGNCLQIFEVSGAMKASHIWLITIDFNVAISAGASSVRSNVAITAIKTDLKRAD